MRHARILVAILALGLVLALVGCGGSGDGDSTGYGGSTTPPAEDTPGSTSGTSGTTITEEGLAFSPTTLTVKVGDTVTFTNNDSAPHNVLIDDQELGTQGQGDSKTWTATAAGSFPFSCTVHPSMTGEITVE